jgi:hypothetical protein
MPAIELDAIEHRRLQQQIRLLPLNADQRMIYHKSTSELYARDQSQLKAITETVRLYNEIALLIREKEPLITERRYIQVRKPQEVKNVSVNS